MDSCEMAPETKTVVESRQLDDMLIFCEPILASQDEEKTTGGIAKEIFHLKQNSPRRFQLTVVFQHNRLKLIGFLNLSDPGKSDSLHLT